MLERLTDRIGPWTLYVEVSNLSGKMFAYRLELGVDNIFNYVDRTMHPYHLGTNTPGRTVQATLTIKFNYGKRVKQHNLSTKQNSNNDEND